MKILFFLLITISSFMRASEQPKPLLLSAKDNRRSRSLIVSPRAPAAQATNVAGSSQTNGASASAAAKPNPPFIGKIAKHASLANVLGAASIERLNATGDPNKDTVREDEFNNAPPGTARLGLSDLQPPPGYVNKGSRHRSGTTAHAGMRGAPPRASFNPQQPVGRVNVTAAAASAAGGLASARASAQVKQQPTGGSGGKNSARSRGLLISATRSSHVDGVATPSGVDVSLAAGPSPSNSRSPASAPLGASALAVPATPTEMGSARTDLNRSTPVSHSSGAGTPRNLAGSGQAAPSTPSHSGAAASGRLQRTVSKSGENVPAIGTLVCVAPAQSPRNGNAGSAESNVVVVASVGSAAAIGSAPIPAANAQPAVQKTRLEKIWAAIKAKCSCCCCAQTEK